VVEKRLRDAGFFCTIVLFANCALYLGTVSLWQSPKSCLGLTPDSLDFGIVQPGEKVQRSVVVTNKSRSPVYIDRVQPSCGCLTAIVPLGVLNPSESVPLELRWTVGSGIGQDHVQVYLDYSTRRMGDRGSTVLNASAHVAAEFIASPSRVTFSRGHRLQVAAVRLARHPISTLSHIRNVRGTIPALTAEVEPTATSGEVLLRVTYDPSRGVLREEDINGIRIDTSSPQSPGFFLPVELE
jgi:hypothetical protein